MLGYLMVSFIGVDSMGWKSKQEAKLNIMHVWAMKEEISPFIIVTELYFFINHVTF